MFMKSVDKAGWLEPAWRDHTQLSVVGWEGCVGRRA